MQIDYPEAVLWFEVVNYNYLGLEKYCSNALFSLLPMLVFVSLSDANMLTLDGCEFILESQLH